MVDQQAGSHVPGKAGPGGLGVVAPPLGELLPVGVIGNRLQSRQGLHSDGVLLLHTKSVGPSEAPRALSAGKVLLHLSYWLGHGKSILGAKPLPGIYIQDLTQHSKTSVLPPRSTDLNTEAQKSQVGAAEKYKIGNLGSLEIPGTLGFSAFSGHPNTWGA